MIIVLVAQLFGSTGYVIEEKFLGDFEDLDPYLMAGLEGVFGFCMWLIVLPILQFIPCSNKELCPYGTVENSVYAFHDFAMQPLHYLWSILIIIIIPILYSCAFNVTKYGSAA